MANLPRRIRIGGLWYKLKTYKMAQGMPLYGQCDFFEQTISRNSMLGAPQDATTISHEIIHAILHNSGLNALFKNNKKEEEFVRQFEPHFHQFLIDNQEYIKYLWRISK